MGKTLLLPAFEKGHFPKPRLSHKERSLPGRIFAERVIFGSLQTFLVVTTEGMTLASSRAGDADKHSAQDSLP